MTENRNVCIRADPVQIGTPHQIESWHRFLKDFVLCMCGKDPLALIIHDAYGDGPDSIPGSQTFTTQSRRGATFIIYQLPEMTGEIFDAHVVLANEFRQNIDLFIWKPRAQIQLTQVQEIINWRDSMFDQPVPFAKIFPTVRCIGFPSEDGECFYWANPDVPLARLELVANAYKVNISEIDWDASGATSLTQPRAAK